MFILSTYDHRFAAYWVTAILIFDIVVRYIYHTVFGGHDWRSCTTAAIFTIMSQHTELCIYLWCFPEFTSRLPGVYWKDYFSVTHMYTIPYSKYTKERSAPL